MSMLCLAMLGVAWAEDPVLEPTGEATEADEREAMAIFDNGRRLYDEGQYEQAIVAFERALALSDRPELYFDIANAKERLGDLQGAIDALMMYRIYADDREQDTLRARVSALQTRVTAETPPPLPSPAPELVPSRSRGAAWALAGFGGVLAAAGGTVAAVTYAQGQQFLDSGDREAWENTRPINNVAIATTIGGAALGITGVTLALRPGSPKSEDR